MFGLVAPPPMSFLYPELLKAGAFYMTTESFRVVETEDEAKAGDGHAIVVATLRLNEIVQPIARELSALAQRAESILIWRGVHATRALKGHRQEFAALARQYNEAISLCHARMGEPVGGGSSIDNAWFQSFSVALGTSALFQLQSTYQATGEILDRKAAYTLAAISLYIAVFSMVLTSVFGWLSLR